jgi:Leucine Rich Repeat (LRR) protein
MASRRRHSRHRKRGTHLDGVQQQPTAPERSGVDCRDQRHSLPDPSEILSQWARTASRYCSWNGGCVAGRSRNRTAALCVSVDSRR